MIPILDLANLQGTEMIFSKSFNKFICLFVNFFIQKTDYVPGTELGVGIQNLKR